MGGFPKASRFAFLQPCRVLSWSDYAVRDSTTFVELIGIPAPQMYLDHYPANIDYYHEYTHKAYGGLMVSYRLLNGKLNICLNLYAYGEQEVIYSYRGVAPKTIKPRAVTNLKISYKFWRNNEIYFNGRNLFNTPHHEFIFTDEIRGLYLVVLHLSF